MSGEEEEERVHNARVAAPLARSEVLSVNSRFDSPELQIKRADTRRRPAAGVVGYLPSLPTAITLELEH